MHKQDKRVQANRVLDGGVSHMQPDLNGLSGLDSKYSLTVAEAAKVIAVCERKVRGLIVEGKIPHFRIGRSVRIPWKPLKEWMDNGGTRGDKQ